MKEVTIGGDRLGAGRKMKAQLHTYQRSTHDISYILRTTMAPGTLVPFMSELVLPGDTFDIELDGDILTHPTIGPLFGSFKIQYDIFQVPVRLYQGKLHMNMLGIGLDMSQVPLPQLSIATQGIDPLVPIDNAQINPSCILSYLGIRGVGYNGADPTAAVTRRFNAIPFLGYWDIYKNYYANKQEEIGAVIHRDPNAPTVTITDADIIGSGSSPTNVNLTINPVAPFTYTNVQLLTTTKITILGTGIESDTDPASFRLQIKIIGPNVEQLVPATTLFQDWTIDSVNDVIVGTNPTQIGATLGFGGISYLGNPTTNNVEPQVVTFPLTNIDNMRQTLLSDFTSSPILIDNSSPAPYGLVFQQGNRWSKLWAQEGLAVKTYNSDLFNNWIDTEWIDGVDGISAVTAVDTSGGSFTIDELNLSKKIYDMLNRIAMSGGSYDDWLDAVYTHDRQRSAENPMYLGGLIQNLVFQEVISNAASEEQPLGTLAGRGRLGNKRKGGQVVAKIDEPSYLMGIISITPNIDYSQGNKWDTNLKTMNDFHKPALDEIGFQDLITDQMAWWDTAVDNVGVTTFKSAGKQPAWINYMTNVNRVLGNFADQTQQMFMVLNRRYNVTYTAGAPSIKDVTTYIDPSKFNHIFADTRRDAQNFWAQIGVKITARRKMSAKVIPNL